MTIRREHDQWQVMERGLRKKQKQKPADALILDFWTPELWDNKFLSFRPLSLVLCCGCPSKPIHRATSRNAKGTLSLPGSSTPNRFCFMSHWPESSLRLLPGQSDKMNGCRDINPQGHCPAPGRTILSLLLCPLPLLPRIEQNRQTPNVGNRP